MFKKFVVVLASLGLIFQLSGCTSKDSKGDGEEMAIDGTETADTAEVEKVEGEQNLDIAADDSSSGAAALSSDALPEDALGETTPPAGGAAPAAPGTAGTDAPPPDVAIADTGSPDALPPDTLGDTGTVAEATPAPAIQEPALSEASSTPADEGHKKEAKPVAAYRKVEATPLKEGGKVLNTVYLARNGDTWASVNKMIYGNGKTAGLKKMNPAIKSRALKTGDKVYYNSPHRPDDDTKVLTYYEDNGLAPEVYIAKSGDDLKKVAKNLLGSKDNWKELYATNDFESKGALDEGTQIKYWKSAPAPAKEVAAGTTGEAAPGTPPGGDAPPAAVDPAMDPAAAMAQNPPPVPPPPGEMAPPPPPPGGDPAQHVAGNEMGAPPPPPPPPAEMAPPPPPPPPPAPPPGGAPPKMAGTEEAAANPLEDDQMTTLAAGAVLAVGLALFMIMRRRRKKELEQAIQDTHVG